MSKEYTGKNIQSVSFMDWVILRPENHISAANEYGQFHIQKEIFSNSIDECELSPNNEIIIYMFLDKRHNYWQTAIRDTGRGIPIEKMHDVFMKEMTSGKFDRESYTTSGGLNGIGAKATVALSENFCAITKRNGKIGKLHVFRTKADEVIIENYPNKTDHGTLVVFEPRKDYFSNLDIFVSEAYNQLVHLVQLVSLFSHNTHIVVKIINKSLDSTFWKLSPLEADRFIENNYDTQFVTIMDGSDYKATINYLKEIWGVDSEFVWTVEDMFKEYEVVHGIKKDIGYTLNMYLPKTIRTACSTVLINNVPVKDQLSSPTIVINNVLKKMLCDFIENKEIQEYFLNIYKLPVYTAISIKYGDAKFDGLAKHSFKNAVFEKEFYKILVDDFEKQDRVLWEKLFNYIYSDIELKYNLYYNKPLTSRKQSRRISMEIKFYDCSTDDRSKAELFIVEGTSANHIVEKRDTKTQAVYMIYGKPLNSYRNVNKQGKTSIDVLKNYPAYKKLIELINIQPGQTDLSTANFGKIVLMNDADVDGSHICSLHLGNIHAINPLIIESGMVYLANPPLYEIQIGTDKKEKRKFVRNKEDLTDFRIDCLYRPTLRLKIGSKQLACKEPIELKGYDYTEFCQIITEIGEIFDNLSSTLSIPLLTLEKLTHLTHLIQPDSVKYDELVQAFGRGTKYNKELNSLTVIDGDDDISFFLDEVAEALYTEVLPYLHKICWKDLDIYATTIYSTALQNVRISITQLYQIFKNLNSKLSVTRQKGLGGMSPEDLWETCLDPQTRFLHHITSIGDFYRIKALLGDDVTERKEILQKYNFTI